MIALSNCLPKRFLLIWGALLTVLGVIAGLFAIQNLPSREASPVPPPPRHPGAHARKLQSAKAGKPFQVTFCN